MIIIMSPPQKQIRRDGYCIICGEATWRRCPACDVVFYCSMACKKLHRKAGHKAPCLRFSKSKLNGPAPKSLTSVLHHQEVEAEEAEEWSYDDFIDLFNSGYKKPVLALNYIPIGLNNRGNSCFLNVTLQCLLFTRPLFAYLTPAGRSHRSRCTRMEWCFLCEFESHVGRSVLNCLPFVPTNILRGLRLIGGDFSWGRQEDAHEFMRFAIDAMQSSCLAESNAPSPDSTLIHYTFGGQLRSEVTCTVCSKTSYRYENMMDLTVEIGETDYMFDDEDDDYTLTDCLDKFTDYEWLEGDNKYKCEGCDAYVRAKKRIQIEHAPNVLTIALKRFNSNGIGKLNDKIVFPTKLNLSNYLSPGAGGDPGDNIYKLYAVVVHKDITEDVAHYICFTKDFRGNWFEINDGRVRKVQQWEVTSERAYMLMYTRARAHPSPLRDPRPPQPQLPDQPLIDPQSPPPPPQLPDQPVVKPQSSDHQTHMEPDPQPTKDEDEGTKVGPDPQPTKDEDEGTKVEPAQSQPVE